MQISDATEEGLPSVQSLKKLLKEVEGELIETNYIISELKSRRAKILDRIAKINHDLRSVLQSKAETKIPYDSQTGFAWSATLFQELKEKFAYDDLRGHQLSVINATMSNRNVFVVMKTGGGKSLCYQLPAVLTKGLTIVVSPLVSLIRDQVKCMNDIYPKSAAAFSGKLEVSDQRQICRDMENNGQSSSTLRLLYVTPEKIHKSKLLMSALQKAYDNHLLTRIVIDEAHCASQWGHDFRPDYAKLGLLKKLFPSVPFLCLTATASASVQKDVIEILCIQGGLSSSSQGFSIDSSGAVDDSEATICAPHMLPPVVLLGDFNRPNLRYAVWAKQNNFDQDIQLVAKALRLAVPGSAAIVYCFTQKETERVADAINNLGEFVAACYHAGLEEDYRNHIQDRWSDNQIQVICATIAFGLGINKSNVRVVVHFTISKSIELYYQESGRASRDGQLGHCVILYHPEDVLRVASVAVNDLELLADGTTRHKILSIIDYCHGYGTCRRKMLSKSLTVGGRCTPSNVSARTDTHPIEDQHRCSDAGHGQFCDNCAVDIDALFQPQNDEPKNINKRLYDAVFQCVYTAASTGDGQSLLTMKKVLDAKVVKSIMKELGVTAWGVEWAICNMIGQDILGIKLHFTPYTTICYLLAKASQNSDNWIRRICLHAPSIAFNETAAVAVAGCNLKRTKSVANTSSQAVVVEISDNDNDSDFEVVESASKKSKT